MGEFKEQKTNRAYFELISGLFLFLILLLVLFTSALGDHQIFLVLIGFFPIMLIVIISLLIHDQYEHHKKIVWLLPFIIVGLFYSLGKANTNIIGSMDVGILSGINFVLGIIYVVVIMSVFKDFKEKKKELPKKNTIIEERRTHHIPAKTENIDTYIHSIEDKSKALNFAIGRVYSQFHGGNERMRDKIRIPKELYNEFSFIGMEKDSIDYKKLSQIISQFEKQLFILEKKERDVFGDDYKDLKNLIREIDGSETIISVLDHNDKDPVGSYFEGAKSFCKKIKEEMKLREFRLVKNKYIPKDEDEENELHKLKEPPKHLKKVKKESEKSISKKEVKKSVPERKPISNHP